MTSYPQNAHSVSQDFLKQGSVLLTTVEGLDAPQYFAQWAANGSTALQLNTAISCEL
jgi:esterase/lipase superfamily enzyme